MNLDLPLRMKLLGCCLRLTASLCVHTILWRRTRRLHRALMRRNAQSSLLTLATDVLFDARQVVLDEFALLRCVIGATVASPLTERGLTPLASMLSEWRISISRLDLMRGDLEQELTA